MRARSGEVVLTLAMLATLIGVPMLAVFPPPWDRGPAPDAQDAPPGRWSEAVDDALDSAFVSSSADFPRDGPVRVLPVSGKAPNDIVPDNPFLDPPGEPERAADAVTDAAWSSQDKQHLHEDRSIERESRDPGRHVMPVGLQTTPAHLNPAGVTLVDVPINRLYSQGISDAEISQRSAVSRRNGETVSPVAPRQWTWESTVERMNEIGVHRYRLTADEEFGFHFYALYDAADQPDVIWRFEADAKTPLEAVSDVMDQIDAWLAGR